MIKSRMWTTLSLLSHSRGGGSGGRTKSYWEQKDDHLEFGGRSHHLVSVSCEPFMHKLLNREYELHLLQWCRKKKRASIRGAGGWGTTPYVGQTDKLFEWGGAWRHLVTVEFRPLTRDDRRANAATPFFSGVALSVVSTGGHGTAPYLGQMSHPCCMKAPRENQRLL